jgi:PleD family two-component response regulator
MIDFDKGKSVPVKFLKPGSSYIFDLFDKNGVRVVPALTIVNEQTLKSLEEKNISFLTYYSDDMIREIDIELEEIESVPELKELYDVLLAEYESIGSDTQSVKVWDEKYTLFFQNIQGSKVLIITKEDSLHQLIVNALEAYLEIYIERNGQKIDTLFKEQDFVIAFLDAQMTDPPALDILGIIRKHATRKKTSVIIMAEKIDKASVVRFRDSGTNNIIVTPFSTNKILQKVFESVTLDRKR